MAGGALLVTGTVAISLEVELGWGLARLDEQPETARHSPERRDETEGLERLLSVCDRLDLPLTFDVVGHLLLEECRGEHPGPHPEGWFDDDPGTSRHLDPLYFAPDLVDRIRDADVDHEIATHTFSHARCDLVDDDVIDWELDRVRETHEAAGIPAPRTFVPPVHGPPPTEVLREHGITGVREPVTLNPPVAERSPPSSLVEYLPWRLRESDPAQVLCRTHPVRDPGVEAGLVTHYSTWHASLTAPYLPNGTRPPHPIYRVIPTSIRQRVHERYLIGGMRDAADGDSYAHFWSHLFNLSNEVQWPPVRAFLERLADRRAAGDVTVATMGSISERVRGNSVSTTRPGGEDDLVR